MSHTVKFLTAWTCYNRGEVAHFPAAVAETLLATKVAEVVEQPMPEPAPELAQKAAAKKRANSKQSFSDRLVRKE
ncbi:hypothetical protein [Paracraurococcus lichenis]|uniref:Uncharacterized protein n=1 Tax=Paracraurococcus lichenis TaxID=3064888 RepID=A0ABT9E720_9PROT|nr:hypothetical protein [Paracraurococcus sp. LOR1-02]MDO9711973.1 hypothetical protein [Paracraurococcus sp. LOR1-02]